MFTHLLRFRNPPVAFDKELSKFQGWNVENGTPGQKFVAPLSIRSFLLKLIYRPWDCR